MVEPIRFYFDQHVWRSLARGLRARGVDLLTAQDAGRCGFSDSDQLMFATAEDRVMMTFDTDYLALHYAGTPHAGIAWCQKRKYTVGELLNSLLMLHGVLTPDEMRGQVEYL